MKKTLLFNFAFLIFNSALFSQTPNWQWAKRIGGKSNDSGGSITTDASGNVYTVGYFSGTVDFDPGIGTHNLTAVFYDIFISKLDNAGNFVWAKRIGGTGNDAGESIAIDALGNVYTTGLFFGTVDFNPGAGIFNLTSAGGADIFISKLDSLGNFIWAKRMGGITYDDGRTIALDVSGNVFTTGSFSGTVDFDPGTNIFNLTAAYKNIFISKVDSSGNFLWAKALGASSGNYYADAFDLVLDSSGNVYTTGRFGGTVDFDPGVLTFNLTSAGTSDIFVSKLNAAGNFVWTKQMRGTYDDEGNSIALDSYGNVYTTGYFSLTVDFDPDSTGIFNLTSAGGPDIFISKLDSSGNFVWAKQMGGINSDYGQSIALDISGNLYLAGCFVDTADFDPDSSGTFNLTSAGNFDIFISKLDVSGNFDWAKVTGGADWDRVYSMALDAASNAYLTGYFKGVSTTFGSTTLINDSAGTFDIFIAKLDSSTITGIESIENNHKGITIFPNPTNNYFTISLPNTNKKVEVTITDATGKIVYLSSIENTPKLEVNIKEFPEGLYQVTLQSASSYQTGKFIVVK